MVALPKNMPYKTILSEAVRFTLDIVPPEVGDVYDLTVTLAIGAGVDQLLLLFVAVMGGNSPVQNAVEKSTSVDGQFNELGNVKK